MMRRMIWILLHTKFGQTIKDVFLWFTGAPGLGKSTWPQLLAKHHGYVYYEADCFLNFKNPYMYIPVDVPDPSMALFNQKSLKGEGLERRKEVCGKVVKGYLRGDVNK